MASTNRKLIGVGILVAIAGAFFSLITGLFPGLGGGTGTGDGTDPDKVDVNASSETTETQTVPTVEQLDNNGLMEIVIDGDNYLVKQSDGKRIKLALADILERAPKMPGNADGILVQVSRKRSSVYAAERELKEKLTAGGVNEEQIDWVEETVE
jgi:hypothetical protein